MLAVFSPFAEERKTAARWSKNSDMSEFLLRHVGIFVRSGVRQVCFLTESILACLLSIKPLHLI